MKIYKFILFDADKTLFDFDDFFGLSYMFRQWFRVEFCAQDYKEFQRISVPLWSSYQNGEITAQDLQDQRFYYWAKKLKTSTEELNTAFMKTMSAISKPLPGVVNLLRFLKNKVRLGIVTNGFTQLQQTRLALTGLKDFFEIHVISEKVGFVKPDPRIFEHALLLFGNPERESVLMVGDSLETDILGGINAKIDTCWLNTCIKPVPSNFIITHQIYYIHELKCVIEGKR